MMGSNVEKACKVCNTPVEVCIKPVRTLQKAGLLHTYYRLITGFYRYITGFTYFLIIKQMECLFSSTESNHNVSSTRFSLYNAYTSILRHFLGLSILNYCHKFPLSVSMGGFCYE